MIDKICRTVLSESEWVWMRWVERWIEKKREENTYSALKIPWNNGCLFKQVTMTWIACKQIAWSKVISMLSFIVAAFHFVLFLWYCLKRDGEREKRGRREKKKCKTDKKEIRFKRSCVVLQSWEQKITDRKHMEGLLLSQLVPLSPCSSDHVHILKNLIIRPPHAVLLSFSAFFVLLYYAKE